MAVKQEDLKMSRSINAQQISADEIDCNKLTLGTAAKAPLASGSRTLVAADITLSGGGAGSVSSGAEGFEAWFSDGNIVQVMGTMPITESVTTSQQIAAIGVPYGACAASSLSGVAVQSAGTAATGLIQVGTAVSGGVQKLIIDAVVSSGGTLAHQYSYSYQLA